MAHEFERLTILARKRAPSALRRLARLGLRAFAKGVSSPQIPQRLLGECRFFANRRLMLEQLPAGGRIAEIGVDRGQFADQILKTCAPSELHLVDLDFSNLDAAVAADPRVIRHHGASHEAIAAFADASFDWIYIDADHSYAGVSRDAKAAAAKVRPGGYLAFNDFAHIDPWLGAYGVHRAVVEFAVANDWPFIFWAYESSALYDVALRRPANAAKR
jgi:hypothetical protein